MPFTYTATAVNSGSTVTSYVRPTLRRTTRTPRAIGASRWSFRRTLTHATGSASGAPVTTAPSLSRAYDAMYPRAAYDAETPANGGVRATHSYVWSVPVEKTSAHTYSSMDPDGARLPVCVKATRAVESDRSDDSVLSSSTSSSRPATTSAARRTDTSSWPRGPPRGATPEKSSVANATEPAVRSYPTRSDAATTPRAFTATASTSSGAYSCPLPNANTHRGVVAVTHASVPLIARAGPPFTVTVGGAGLALPATQSANANRTTDAWPSTGTATHVATVSAATSSVSSTVYPPALNHAARTRSIMPTAPLAPLAPLVPCRAHTPGISSGAGLPSTVSSPPAGAAPVSSRTRTRAGAPNRRPVGGTTGAAVDSYTEVPVSPVAVMLRILLDASSTSTASSETHSNATEPSCATNPVPARYRIGPMVPMVPTAPPVVPNNTLTSSPGAKDTADTARTGTTTRRSGVGIGVARSRGWPAHGRVTSSGTAAVSSATPLTTTAHRALSVTVTDGPTGSGTTTVAVASPRSTTRYVEPTTVVGEKKAPTRRRRTRAARPVHSIAGNTARVAASTTSTTSSRGAATTRTTTDSSSVPTVTDVAEGGPVTTNRKPVFATHVAATSAPSTRTVEVCATGRGTMVPVALVARTSNTVDSTPRTSAAARPDWAGNTARGSVGAPSGTRAARGRGTETSPTAPNIV